MNSPDFTSKYFNDIIASREEQIKCIKNKEDYASYHKNNFRLISNLVDDLFQNKNSRGSFETLSNLIVVTLNSREPYLPVDIYSSKSTNVRGGLEHKEALRKEILGSNYDQKYSSDMKRRIRDIFSRFLERYDRIDNIEFGPRLKKNVN